MEHFAGLDLSVKETSICIEDDFSSVRKVKVASERRTSASALASGGLGSAFPPRR